MQMKLRSRLLAVGLFWFPGLSAAVLFYSTGDPSFNTNAPTGELADSGWQFQGKFRDGPNDKYLGTPIAPHHFITAKHISGVAVGEPFQYGGLEYITIAKINDPDHDLTLWEVDGTFPTYAPLYSGSSEVGQGCVVIGRGTQRGDAVVANGETKGWKWGAKDFVIRWGTNEVSGIADYNAGDSALLVADFDFGAGTNECMLSDKDSGGALFIKDGDVWKLAGINISVWPASFSYSPSGSDPFAAALYDYSFLKPDAEKVYYWTGTSWTYEMGQGALPCSFLSVRISARYDWITNNIPDFDQDVDGLPDWWEVLYGGDAISMDAAADPDNDGFSNYDEWVADTVPTNGASFLQITDWVGTTNLTFSSSSNRQYQVEFQTNLVTTATVWQAETAWVTGTVPQTSLSVSDGTTNRFFRVRAKVR